MQLSRAFWSSRDFPLFESEGEKGGGGGGSGSESESKSGAESEKKSEQKDEFEGLELGDKGKAAIKAERDARKAAEDAKKASDDELTTLRKEKSEREAAETKRKDDEAKQKGEFEQLAAKREQERDEAKKEATSLKAENDQLRAAISTVLDSEWKDLPKEVAEAYLGADDDPLAKLAFLPKGKVLAVKLAEKSEAKRGNGIDPKSNGNTKGNDEAARKSQAALYRNF